MTGNGTIRERIEINGVGHIQSIDNQALAMLSLELQQPGRALRSPAGSKHAVALLQVLPREL